MKGSGSLIGRDDISLVTRKEFAQGCTLCFGGLKSVIFITGLCRESCYYCPVNRSFLYRDIIKVNEKEVYKIEEIPAEVSRAKSKGASLTGGDPLTTPKKTVEAIGLLKSVFGSGFHIHLYTTGRDLTLDLLRALERAGLDEIRFHPVRRDYLKKIEMVARHSSIDFGIEIPSIPNSEEQILELAIFLEKIGGKFLNLNELEVSPDNFYQLLARGFKINPSGVSVNGSLETAKKAMQKALDLGLSLPIHFCPATYKDKFQTRLRFTLTGRNCPEVYEENTGEGTLLTVKIEGISSVSCNEIMESLIKGSMVFEVRGEYYVNPRDFPRVKSEMGDCLSGAVLLERHPDYRRTEVNETPLK